MRTQFYLLVISIFLLSGCNKSDSDIRLSEMQKPVLTGFYFYDEIGNPLYSIGNPNVILQIDSENQDFSVLLMNYPNPVREAVNVAIKPPPYEVDIFIWIVPASYPYDDPDMVSALGMNNILVGGAPVFEDKFSANTSDYKNILIRTSDIPDGYYRIYVKAGDFLLYNNLIINKSYFP